MTSIDDLIERLSTEGRDALRWDDEPVLLAALRLAESCTHERDEDGAWLDFDTDALADYRSAREGLANAKEPT